MLLAPGGPCTYNGCMDPAACNYSAIAEADDGSCDYSCCPGPGCCGERARHWDAYLATCVVDAPDPVDAACTLMNLQELARRLRLPLSNRMPHWTASCPLAKEMVPQRRQVPAPAKITSPTTATITPSSRSATNVGLQRTSEQHPIRTEAQSMLLQLFLSTMIHQTLTDYGLLYAGDAIFNGLGICPTSWHLGSFTEWQD